MRSRRSTNVVALSALAALAACTSDPGTSGQTRVVVGIQGDDLPQGVIGRLQIAASVDGANVTNESVPLAGASNALPRELELRPRSGSGGKVDVKVEGFASTQAGPPEAPMFTRLATTEFVPGQSRLLRLALESRCLSGGPGSSFAGPSCAAPLTCIGGRCIESTVLPQDLEPYSATWASNAPDICRPLGAGPAEVIVGTGQTDYLSLVSGQTLQLERGPQGGHHIWIAARMRNIKQSGSTTTLTAIQPDTNVKPEPTAFVFTFEKDEGGYCKLYGLRFQLDVGGIDYQLFLGKPLDVKVEIADRAGNRASGTTRVQIGPTVLCPGGVPGC